MKKLLPFISSMWQGSSCRQCYFRSAFLDTEVNKIATSHKLGHEIYLCAMNLLMENELLLQDDKNQGIQGLLVEIWFFCILNLFLVHPPHDFFVTHSALVYLLLSSLLNKLFLDFSTYNACITALWVSFTLLIILRSKHSPPYILIMF